MALAYITDHCHCRVYLRHRLSIFVKDECMQFFVYVLCGVCDFTKLENDRYGHRYIGHRRHRPIDLTSRHRLADATDVRCGCSVIQPCHFISLTRRSDDNGSYVPLIRARVGCRVRGICLISL